MISERVIVGLDVGTVNVKSIIGVSTFNRVGDPIFKIVGIGSVPSEGIKNGVVINKEAASSCIAQAIDAAQQMAGRDVEGIIVGIGGEHIKGENSTGVVAVQPRRRDERPEVTDRDIQKVMDSAGNIPAVSDREIVYRMPIEFKVDNRSGIKNPINMFGGRLEVNAHIITASRSAIKNLRNCISAADYDLENNFPITLADCKAVLSPEEEKAGVILIDIGGGTTDIGIQMDGATYYTGVVPMGGRLVTSDLAIVLKLTTEDAESIKINQGTCHESYVDANENIIMPISSGTWADKNISKQEVYEIIRARMWEILTEAKKAVIDSRCMNKVNGGIVLTGGGAMLSGACELASEIFGMPARLGYPQDLDKDEKDFSNPKYVGAIGLAKIAFDQMEKIKKRPDIEVERDDFDDDRYVSSRKSGDDDSVTGTAKKAAKKAGSFLWKMFEKL